MKRVLSAALAIMLLLLCCSGAFARGAEAVSVRGQAGTDVSGFSSVCLDGSAADGSLFNGNQVNIVVYFATWSGDALRQLAYLESVHAQRPDIGVFGLLKVDATSTAEAAAEFVSAHGYTFPVFTADSVWQGVVSQLAYMPQIYFISPCGIILEAWTGAFSSASVLLSEAEELIGPYGTYCVRFFDNYEGVCTLLASYTGVEEGAYAAPPAVPVYEGCRFMGWSTDDFACVNGNLDVFTRYAMLPDGDIDGNGTMDSLDALTLLRVSLNLLPLTEYCLIHGDMDLDGRISANDALIVLRLYMLGTASVSM